MTQYPPTPQYGQQYYIEQPPSSWPKVIGIISIVLASLGLVCGALGLIGNAVTHSFLPASQPTPVIPEGFKTFQILEGVVALVISFCLLSAGIMTLHRRPAGRTMHLVYAFLKLALLAVGSVISFAFMGDVLEAGGQDVARLKTITIGVSIFGVIAQCVYPVFLLIWLNRSAVKAEVATWSAGAPRQ